MVLVTSFSWKNAENLAACTWHDTAQFLALVGIPSLVWLPVSLRLLPNVFQCIRSNFMIKYFYITWSTLRFNKNLKKDINTVQILSTENICIRRKNNNLCLWVTSVITDLVTDSRTKEEEEWDKKWQQRRTVSASNMAIFTQVKMVIFTHMTEEP